MPFNLSDKNIKYFILFYTFIYMILHYQAHIYITGGYLPPDSDSLSYQYYALDALRAIAAKTFNIHTFLFGNDIDSVPPVYKITLLLAYLFGGLNSGSEYLINYLIVLLGGYYLGKISFFIYKNTIVQYLTFLAYITLHGVTIFSLYDTRNDTLTITFYIMAIYYLFKSDFFYDLKYSIIVSLLIALALLSKSAFTGYIALPFFSLLCLIYKTDNKQIRYRNVVIGSIFIFLSIVWYYIVKYNAIIDYYSYWSHELASIVYEQYNLETFYDKVIFYPQSTLNHFGYLFFLFIPFLVYELLLILFKKQNLSFNIKKELVFLVSLIILPYIVLYANGSYSIVADLYMVPFILIIMMSLFDRYKKHQFIYILLFLFIGFIGLYNVAQHYSKPVLNSINYKHFIYELDKITNKYSSSEKSCDTLFSDLDLEMKTIEYINMKDVYLRSKSTLSIADVSYKTKVAPNLSADVIYNKIKNKSNILLITSSSKGPKWININKKWRDLYTLIKADKDMLKIGEIDTYLDKTKVEVYLKSDISYGLSSDGWLLNQSIFYIVANPGKYLIKIVNLNNISNIDELFLKNKEGKIYNLKKEVVSSNVQYSCVLDSNETITTFSIYSNKPLMPSSVSNSQDNRSLLFYKPRITIERKD